MERIVYNNINGVFFTDSEIETLKKNLKEDVVERKELITTFEHAKTVCDNYLSNADSIKGITY